MIGLTVLETMLLGPYWQPCCRPGLASHRALASGMPSDVGWIAALSLDARVEVAVPSFGHVQLRYLCD